MDPAFVDIGAPPARGKREQRKAMTRSELLLAGRRLFSERGLYESRVEDLTRTAGIAKGTLYQYYRNKEELVEAVVAAGLEALERHLGDRIREPRTLHDLLGQVIDAYLEFATENPDLMRIFDQARGLLKFNHGRWSELRKTLAVHVDRLADLLGGAAPAARLERECRRDLAIVLSGAVSGIDSLEASIDPGDSSLHSIPARPLAAAFAAMARTYIANYRSPARELERRPPRWQPG